MKRKTPSELRGEQLKRRTHELLVNEELPPLQDYDRADNRTADGPKKAEHLKIPKYINTRMVDVYPIKKSSERCRVLFGKENVKVQNQDHSTACAKPGDLSNATIACSFSTKATSFPCGDGVTADSLEPSDPSVRNIAGDGFQKIDKCSQNPLRSVVELHVGNEKLVDSAKLDMEKALKGLVARDVPSTSSLADSSRRLVDVPSISSDVYPSEIHIPGDKVPLDFTLKTSLRLVSSSSVKWFHKVRASFSTAGINRLTSQCCSKSQSFGCTSGTNVPSEQFSKALYSWVYPQSSLPPSIISAMASSSIKGETDFLQKRQHDWEDSFCNLYYMLRKNKSTMFYVYTSQFVVLFIGGVFLGKKQSCNAYLSQSTRGLRSLLKKHDICFSMPLCRAEVEQASEDDLVELSEIEKRNLGQAFLSDSFSDIDNTPQSLLSFIGNESVHGLYDFLLNYRFFLSSFSGVDVPVLYSPVPFQNACFFIPEVRCKEMRKANMVVPSSRGSESEEQTEAILGSSGNGICYSIEIKDTILPPWIVSGVCATMSSDGRSFDSVFSTEPSSVGLNVAMDSFCKKSESDKHLSESCDAFGISETTLVPSLRSVSVRRLKYADGAYVAFTTV
ncbi:protein downstream neighbor of Son isoform X1 [Ananas comosus]|uniref:Protein downstream neighbor of Son isoform X1 n=1 Tax=Ananas comosus TaxID=4615 RepID=A0A6P5F722_ANACO|nr:protein downstream neighbor of Son isoform X1 [Ananas comosus]